MTELEQRWNKAASKAGFAGSEYVDDPELVFSRVALMREMLGGLAKRWRERAIKNGEEVTRLQQEVETAFKRGWDEGHYDAWEKYSGEVEGS